MEDVAYYECLKLYKDNSEGRQKAEKSLADLIGQTEGGGNPAVKRIAGIGRIFPANCRCLPPIF
ncbi:MAG: hypothetical protein LH614_19025 [Pyrinomonadaceae bacterium]|nr:hypothetical protein [Pyrinomonadaceae bacterium]